MSMLLITEESGIVPFYNGIGAAVLGTVMDGDCGIDTMCMMLITAAANV